MDLRRVDKDEIFEMAAGILLVVYGMVYALRGTLIEVYLGGVFRVVGLLTAVILLVLTGYRLLGTFPERRKLWLLAQLAAGLYLLLRFLTILRSGFTGAAFEDFLTADVLYLVALTALAVDGDVVRKLMLPAFAIMQMVVSLLEIFCIIVTKLAPEGEVGSLLLQKTFLSENDGQSALYRDPLQMGIMVGFSVIVMVIVISQDEEFLNRVLGGIYCLLSFALLLQAGSRMVYIALGAAIVLYVLIRGFGLFNPRLAVLAVLAVTILLTGASLRESGMGFGLTLITRVLFAAVLGIRVWHADSLSEGRLFPIIIYALIAGGLDLSGTPGTMPLMLFVFLVLAAGPDEGDRNEHQRMGAYFTGLKGWN